MRKNKYSVSLGHIPIHQYTKTPLQNGTKTPLHHRYTSPHCYCTTSLQCYTTTPPLQQNYTTTTQLIAIPTLSSPDAHLLLTSVDICWHLFDSSVNRMSDCQCMTNNRVKRYFRYASLKQHGNVINWSCKYYELVMQIWSNGYANVSNYTYK